MYVLCVVCLYVCLYVYVSVCACMHMLTFMHKSEDNARFIPTTWIPEIKLSFSNLVAEPSLQTECLAFSIMCIYYFCHRNIF